MLVSGSVRRHCRTDAELLAKLSAGDLVALEDKYHTPCLASLYKKAQRVKRKAKEMGQVLDDRRVSCLWSWFPLLKSRAWSVLPFFRLAELVGKYTSCLKQLGENTAARIHTARLKDRILSQISALEEHKQGHDVFFLAFKNDLANAQQKARKEDGAEEAMHLAKAASIMRKEMFTQKKRFDGSFQANC